MNCFAGERFVSIIVKIMFSVIIGVEKLWNNLNLTFHWLYTYLKYINIILKRLTIFGFKLFYYNF